MFERYFVGIGSVVVQCALPVVLVGVKCTVLSTFLCVLLYVAQFDRLCYLFVPFSIVLSAQAFKVLW